MRWHECWAVAPGVDWFRCHACNFFGTLADAIRHVVAHQEDLRPRP